MNYRLFIALNLPSEVKNEIEALIAPWEEKTRGLPWKWVERENLHLTLHFLGSQDENALEDLKTLLASEVTKFPILNLQTGDAGAFPDSHQPKIIYLKLEEVGGDNLSQLQKSLSQGLKKLGFETDSRPWRPHITLARAKTPCCWQLPKIDLKTQFQIATVDLMSSDLTPSGPVYTILEKFELIDKSKIKIKKSK